MMSIYDDIREEARKLDIEATPSVVNRVAGTLRMARIRSVAKASTLVGEELRRLAAPNTAGTPVDAFADTFQKIDASVQHGGCPRCGARMTDVYLADSTPAFHCSGECRVTLPQQKAVSAKQG